MPRALLSRRAAKPLGPWATGAFLCLLLGLPGCTVIAVTGATVGVAASAVGLAADAAIGTAKVVGHGVGKAADALRESEPHQTPTPPHTGAAGAPPAAAALPQADIPLAPDASRAPPPRARSEERPILRTMHEIWPKGPFHRLIKLSFQ